MVFGQVVIGPPGSGKTTYCNGMRQFLTGLGRKVAIVNLDPANDVRRRPGAHRAGRRFVGFPCLQGLKAVKRDRKRANAVHHAF